MERRWTRRVTRARAYDANFSLLPLEFSLFLKTASQNLTDRIFDKDAFVSRAVFYVHNKLSKMKNRNSRPCEAILAYLKWTIKENQKLWYLANGIRKSSEHRGIAFRTKLNWSRSNLLVDLFRVKLVFSPLFFFFHYYCYYYFSVRCMAVS